MRLFVLTGILVLICNVPLAGAFDNIFTQAWQDSTWAEGALFPASSLWSMVGPFDSDGDGLLEFAASSSWSGSLGNDVAVYEVTGDNQPELIWYFNLEPYGFNDTGNTTQVEVGDLDGDENLEIIVLLDTTIGQDGFHVFEYNPVTESFPVDAPTTSWDIELSFLLYEAGDMVVADLDGDGVQEVAVALVTALDWLTSQFTIFSLASGTDFSNPTWNIEFNDGSTLSTAGYLSRVTDLDQDGHREIVLVGWEWFHFAIYEAGGADDYALQTDFYVTFEPLSHCRRGAFEGNFDGDAVNELYMVSTGVDTIDGHLWCVTNDGDVANMSYASSFNWLQSFPMADYGWDNNELLVGNLDSPSNQLPDGPDIYIAGGWAGKVYDLEYEGGDVTLGTSYTTYELWQTPFYGDTEQSWFRPAMMLQGDFDQDGKGDLIVSSGDFTNQDEPHLVWLESDGVSAVGDETLPAATTLQGIYPNPFNPQTVIAFDLDRAVPVRLEIYDATGARVRALVADTYPAGRHEVVWNGRDDGGRSVASGTYMARLTAAGRLLSQKMVLIR